jgi:hypothetical protein
VIDCRDKLDLCLFTQPVAGRDRSNWQAPYDEHFLDASGQLLDEKHPYEQPAIGTFRLVFYFHYFDPGRPLEGPIGPIRLPAESTIPARLSFIHYFPP